MNEDVVTIKQVRQAFNDLFCVGCCYADCSICKVGKIEGPLINTLESLAIINSIDEIQKARENEPRKPQKLNTHQGE